MKNFCVNPTMANRKNGNKPDVGTPLPADVMEMLEDPWGGSVELDSVDWGAVARSYKLLHLHAKDPETFRSNEKLSERYSRWISMRMKSIEFDIAMRMFFNDTLAWYEYLTDTGDMYPTADNPETVLDGLSHRVARG